MAVNNSTVTQAQLELGSIDKIITDKIRQHTSIIHSTIFIIHSKGNQMPCFNIQQKFYGTKK
jgi:hypothetical protein